MLVVVSYDVATVDAAGRRRLRRVARACENYGQRVQDSIFECVVDPARWELLRAHLLDIIDEEQDSLRFYFLGSNYRNRIEHHGIERSFDVDDPLIL